MGSIPSAMADNFPIPCKVGAGAEVAQQNHDEPTVYKPDLQNFDEVWCCCYEYLKRDFGTDWHKEGTLHANAMFRLYNYICPENADDQSGMRWLLFGDTEASSSGEGPSVNGSQGTETQREDTPLKEDSWVNDKLGLRLSATQFKDYVMLADPLVGFAAAPWFQPIKILPTSIPPHFPSPISRIISQLPLFDVETGHNLQKVAVDFINATFSAENPADMHILRRIGAFLTLGLPDTHKDIARSFVFLIRRVHGWKKGQTFPIGDLLAFHEWVYLWKSWFFEWLDLLPMEVIEAAIGIPMTAMEVSHVLHHLQVNVGEGIDFTMTMTECEEPFYSGHPSSAKVKAFVAALPTVNVDELAEDDRDCAICRGPYGEPGSMLDGEPEEAVKLPCTHVFGKSCLTVLLGPKPEGWGQRLCPVCRQDVPLFPRMIPSGFRQ